MSTEPLDFDAEAYEDEPEDMPEEIGVAATGVPRAQRRPARRPEPKSS